MGFPMAMPCVECPCLPGVLSLGCSPRLLPCLWVLCCILVSCLASATLSGGSPLSLAPASCVVMRLVPSLFCASHGSLPTYMFFSVLFYFPTSAFKMPAPARHYAAPRPQEYPWRVVAIGTTSTKLCTFPSMCHYDNLYCENIGVKQI